MSGLNLGVKPCLTVILRVKVVLKRTLVVVVVNVKSFSFPTSIRNCLNCVHNCEDQSLLNFTSAVQYMKYFIYNFTLLIDVSTT